jgi:Zn-dependent metalloprotease
MASSIQQNYDRLLCSIVPPDLLERVARTGAPAERDTALRTLALDASMRAARFHNAAVAMAQPLFSAPLHDVGGEPHRTIYDARHTDNIEASSVLRTEGQPPIPDQSADQAYDALGDTYRFFWDVYQRDSIDGIGMPLVGEVHFAHDYDNAFWDGRRMIFGDGDGRLFTGFTSAIDVVGHELTHGVTQFTLNLNYLGQPGALNESISDVFGSLVKQYTQNQTADQADWLIGSGILGPALHGQALRSLKVPGTAYEGDSQPSHMSKYVRTTFDNGGVQINSGIPNRAFYLCATALQGHAWEKAGRIWWETLATRAVGPNASFGLFAIATIRAATQLHGATSTETKAVTEAWAEVGVLRTTQIPA